MQKIIIVGSPGAGKSVFAKRLRGLTGLPLYYLDLLYHTKDRTIVSRDEFDARLAEILRLDEWIIDGNYQRTLEWRLAACDTAILLDYPTEVCLEGIKSRIGKRREGFPWTESEIDMELEKKVLRFLEDKLPMIYELFEKYRSGRDIVVFRTREEADEYLDKLKCH